MNVIQYASVFRGVSRSMARMLARDRTTPTDPPIEASAALSTLYREYGCS